MHVQRGGGVSINVNHGSLRYWCLHLKPRNAFCRILATCYHPQCCVIGRLEAPWVLAWGSRIHQFEIWWLKSVRIWYWRETGGRQGDFWLYVFRATEGWIKFSSEYLSFSSWKQKVLCFNKSTCLRWKATTGSVEAELFCSCVAQVCSYWGSETVRVLWDPIKAAWGSEDTRGVVRWAQMRRTRGWCQR